MYSVIVFCCVHMNNYGQEASQSIVSPKMVQFLLVGNLYTRFLIDIPVCLIFL